MTPRTTRQKAGIAAAVASIAAGSEGLRQYLSTPFTPVGKSSCSGIPLRYFAQRPNRGCRRFFKRPSSRSNPIVHQSNRYSIRFGYSSPRNSVATLVDYRPVSGLGFSIRPSAIVGRISERIVFSFYRKVVTVARRYCPSVEIFKLSPFVADGYSFPAIRLVGHVSAPAKHIAPAGVYPRPFHSVCCGPSADSCSRAFTPTRNAFPITQVGTNNNTLCPARTAAQPQSSASRCVPGFLYDEPLAKIISGHIDKFWVPHFNALRYEHA